MAYPPYLARLTHFQYDANAGIDSPAPSGVDAEFDAVLESMNQQNLFIRRITQADGRLKNLAAATAMALAGTDEVTATTPAQTDFVTGITWDSAFTAGAILVFSGASRVEVSAVADDGNGFLEITVAAQDNGTVLDVLAFSAGAGILTRLQDQTVGEGADLIAAPDPGGFTALVTVGDQLQELYDHTSGANGKSWLEGVLAMSDYLKKSGGTMTGDIDMDGNTISGLPASANNGEAVRHEQLVALTTSISGITATFMPKAGGTFTGGVDMNGQVLEGIPTPSATDHAASKGYVDTTLASFGGLPVGTLVDFGGASTPTGWLLCDGAAVSRTTYASLFAVIGVLWGVGDGSTTFNVPDFRGRVAVGSGTGSGLTPRTLADDGGEEEHVLTVAELPAHDHDVTNTITNTGGGLWGSGSSGAPATTTSSSVGADAAHNTMQPFAVVTKIIKH